MGLNHCHLINDDHLQMWWNAIANKNLQKIRTKPESIYRRNKREAGQSHASRWRFWLISVYSFCMRTVLLTGPNTHSQAFLMSWLVNLLAHGTCLYSKPRLIRIRLIRIFAKTGKIWWYEWFLTLFFIKIFRLSGFLSGSSPIPDKICPFPIS